MKLFAPGYYKSFKCIADKCEHSCCIGWEIDIDSDTAEKYRNFKNGYGLNVKNSVKAGDVPCFILGALDRCPHLNENGLCNIILNLGEDHLCDICREHPRFYNYTDMAEVGIGMSCIEAARVILSSPDYASMEEIGVVEAYADDVTFNGRYQRDKIYAILQSNAANYISKLNKIYSEHEITVLDDKEQLEMLESLEYLDSSHKALFIKYSSERRKDGADTDKYLERFLAYLIYRHCTEALDENDFCVRLSFCLFCERLLASLIVSESAESLQEIAHLASIISEEIEYSDDNTFALMC